MTYIQSKYDENIKNKSLFCTIVATRSWSTTDKNMDELSKYGDIKSAGSFRLNTNHIGSKLKDKIDYISNGIYTICPENTMYEGYFTEKIFHI